MRVVADVDQITAAHVCDTALMPPIEPNDECELEASIAATSMASTITEEHENKTGSVHFQQQPPPTAVGTVTANLLLGNFGQQQEENIISNRHASLLPFAISGRPQHSGVCDEEEILSAAVGSSTEPGNTKGNSKGGIGGVTHQGRRRGSRRDISQMTAKTAVDVGPFDEATCTETRKPAEYSRPLRPGSGEAMDALRSATQGSRAKRNGGPYGRSPNSCKRHLRQARGSTTESQLIVLGDGTTIEVAAVGTGRGAGSLPSAISFFNEKAESAVRQAHTQVCAANLAVRLSAVGYCRHGQGFALAHDLPCILLRGTLSGTTTTI